MDKSGKERIGYLDTAKAILILLVVLGHILIVLNPRYDRLSMTAAQALISTFHMPAFFVLHGILFDAEKQRQRGLRCFVQKKVRTLLVPYLFFELIGMTARGVLYGQPVLTGVMNLLTVRCNVGADWFLPALFLGSMGIALWAEYPNRLWGGISAFLCLVIPSVLPSDQFFRVLGRAMLAYAFIMAGYLAKQVLTSFMASGGYRFFASLAVTGCIAIIGLKFGGNDFYSCTISHPLLFMLGGVSGTIMVLTVARWLDTAILRKLGRHTLTIMGTHQLVIYGMTRFFPELQGGSVPDGILLLGVMIIAEVPVVCLLDRFCPVLVGRAVPNERTPYEY